jgi:ribosomal protein S27AE
VENATIGCDGHWRDGTVVVFTLTLSLSRRGRGHGASRRLFFRARKSVRKCTLSPKSARKRMTERPLSPGGREAERGGPDDRSNKGHRDEPPITARCTPCRCARTPHPAIRGSADSEIGGHERIACGRCHRFRLACARLELLKRISSRSPSPCPSPVEGEGTPSRDFWSLAWRKAADAAGTLSVPGREEARAKERPLSPGGREAERGGPDDRSNKGHRDEPPITARCTPCRCARTPHPAIRGSADSEIGGHERIACGRCHRFRLACARLELLKRISSRSPSPCPSPVEGEGTPSRDFRSLASRKAADAAGTFSVPR